MDTMRIVAVVAFVVILLVLIVRLKGRAKS
jgi:hypothetical protein